MTLYSPPDTQQWPFGNRNLVLNGPIVGAHGWQHRAFEPYTPMDTH